VLLRLRRRRRVLLLLLRWLRQGMRRVLWLLTRRLGWADLHRRRGSGGRRSEAGQSLVMDRPSASTGPARWLRLLVRVQRRLLLLLVMQGNYGRHGSAGGSWRGLRARSVRGEGLRRRVSAR
jgi:hypothetical protein